LADFIAFILALYLDIKHWFKVKKRRRFEKENNLPKSFVWHPMTMPLLLFFTIFTVSFSIVSYSYLKDKSIIKTDEKLDLIITILESEKRQSGYYPKELKSIIRNNPLRKNIILDGWNNEFVYTLSKDSLNYTLISFGKDRKPSTSDDIQKTN
jgi:general secretion pathway protein G